MPAKTHGLSGSSEHAIWRGMIQRCTNDNNPAYSSYGDRGIVVCDRWLNSFEAFYEDMGPRPSGEHSIERRNNDCGYTPDNCYWGTAHEQSNNRRNNVKVKIDGQNINVSEAARLTGIKAATLRRRLHAGVSTEDVLRTDRLNGHNPPTLFEYEGKTQTAAAWAREKGMTERTVDDRVFKQGMSIEEALTKPLKETYQHDGKDLTMAEWSRLSGIPETTLYHRLKVKKLPIDQALNYKRT